MLKMCQINCLRANCLSNKLPTNCRGLVTVAESSNWLVWPDGPSTKNEQCSPAARMQIFRSESNIKRATYLSRRDSFLSSKDPFCSSRDIYFSMRTKKCQKMETYLFMCTGPYDEKKGKVVNWYRSTSYDW